MAVTEQQVMDALKPIGGLSDGPPGHTPLFVD